MLDKLDEKLNNILSKEDVSVDNVVAAFFIFIIVSFIFLLTIDGPAKRYEMEGEITKITWRCTARDIPTITFKDVTGELKAVCFDSVVLKREDIKVGDYIVKKKGSSKALVNGKEVQFAYER